jgi:hypothetical protein
MSQVAAIQVCPVQGKQVGVLVIKSGRAMSLQATLVTHNYNFARKYSGNDRGASDMTQCHRTSLHIIIIIIIPQRMPAYFECLVVKDGIYTLFRNVGSQIPTHAM